MKAKAIAAHIPEDCDDSRCPVCICVAAYVDRCDLALVERIRQLERWAVPAGYVGGDDSDTYPMLVVRWTGVQQAIGEPL